MTDSETRAPPRSPPLSEVFHTAARIVAGVGDGQTPDAALAALPPALRPAVMDSVFATLRAYGRGDFLLLRLMDRPLKAPLIGSLLRVALARLEAEPDRAPTVVDQAVGAVDGLGPSSARFKGLVNGVLRSFLRQRDALLAQAEQDPVAHGRHPAWWIARLQADHPAAWQEILAAGNTHPPMTLRVNRRRIAVADYRDRLAAAGIATDRLEGDALRLANPVAVDRLPGFADGLCSVQDAGAQRAAALLDLRDGLRVLDACAAPGGKAAHLLETAAVDLTALDADAARTRRIAGNLARLGLAAEIKVARAQDVSRWWDGRPFDRVLADVPCSASGVVRRHPDAKWLRREADIARFAAAQAEIVDAVWQTLARDGKMLYATCSVFAGENGDRLAAFLARHADARLLNQLALLPNDDHDGFFYALLQKT